MAAKLNELQRVRKKRRPTGPTAQSRKQRLESKRKRSDLKRSRSRLTED